MKNSSIRFLALIAIGVLQAGVFGQGSPRPSVVTGDVVSVGESKIVLKTKDGEVDIVLSGTTEFKKVPPDNPVLKAAVASAISDISAGDKLLVTGVFGEDKTKLPARSVYLMSKSDIAQKQAKEQERWATRGISGRVSAVNTNANQVTIEVRGLMNSTSVVVTAKPEAVFKRYKQDSVKYSEAVESSVAEIKPGDMFRAVGDRSADGTTFTAEEILTGAFQTVAGTVKTIDAEKGEVIVTQAGTDKEVTIAVTPSSAIKRFPEEMATRMAGLGAAGGQPGGIRPAGGPPAGQGGTRPAGAAPGQGAGGAGRARAGIDDMFERFPTITVGDLKPGDVIAVSSSKNGNADRITAIKLLAGVGPFIRAAQMQAAAAGGRGNSGGGQGSFTIPGLEGFDNP
ncbi:MAG: hypothetical protein AB7V18_04295 [Pyrinomonadaceae bacterium]